MTTRTAENFFSKFSNGSNSNFGKPKTVGKPEALSGELLETLKQGASSRFILLTNVIEQIREVDAALADALARLAKDFEYDEILELLRKADAKHHFG